METSAGFLEVSCWSQHLKPRITCTPLSCLKPSIESFPKSFERGRSLISQRNPKMGLIPPFQRKNEKLFKSHKGGKKQQSLQLTSAAEGVRKEFEKTLKMGVSENRRS